MEHTIKNTATALTAVFMGLSMVACSSMSSPTSMPPGQYSKTQSDTDAGGTEHSTTTDTNVYYDANGNKKAVQQTQTTNDPPGLLNKKTSTTTKTYQ